MASESLLKFVEKYASHRSQVAVRQPRGYRMESWTYGRIAGLANQVARELAARGIRKGDAIVLCGANSAEWTSAILGCIVAGVVAVPIDRGSTPEFTERVGREIQAKLIFRPGETSHLPDLPALSLESLPTAVSGHAPSPFPSPHLSRQDTLQIIFTSGATAEPRGVVISHGNVLANIEPLESEMRKYLRYERLVHPVRFLNLLPLSHVFGQMLGIFIPPLLAGTVLFTDSLKPADLAATIRRERVSVLVAVPRFMESLQREIERKEEQSGHSEAFQQNLAAAEQRHFLRRWWRFRRVHARLGWKFWALISGGAALPRETEVFWNRLGYAVIQGYGMTETTSLISLNHPFHSDRGSIGKVFPGLEIRVDGNGEILVRGESVAKAYKQKGQTKTLAESDGWFRTGDLAERDESGRLYFKGRSKNLIVTSGGMNVYPEDLERALRAQPGVRDCVVVGLRRNGDEVPGAAVLMIESGMDLARVIDEVNQKLAEYQRIRKWVLWPEPDFPRTPTQKPVLPVIRAALESATSETNATLPSSASLAGFIARITKGSGPHVPATANLETDLGLTSLDRVELVNALEQRYQVQLEDADIQKAGTLGDIQRLLSGGALSGGEHVYPRWPQSWLVTWLRMSIYYLLAWPATYLLAAPRIRGRENLRDLRGPVLIVSNHVTYLDIAWILPALPVRMRHRLATAMGGERLARMRRPSEHLQLFERCMERLRYVLVTSLFNVFPLPQHSGFLKSFRFAGDLTDRGWNILVFPEGRTTDGVLAPFRSGIGLLAAKLGIPVVPIYLNGLSELKKEGRILARPGQVQVTVGKPARPPESKDPRDIAADLERRVRELQSL